MTRRAPRATPLVAVLLLVLLALGAAYSVRPDVRVDVGTSADAPFLTGFHAREYSPVDPEQRYAWPAGSDTLTISDGLRPSFRMVTYTLDAFAPSGTFPRRLIAVYVDGRRFDTITDRGGAREFRALLPEGAIDGAPIALRIEALADKTLDIPPVQVESAVLSGARTYRWTTGDGRIGLPALGRGAWKLDLTAVVAHPDGSPVRARVLVNGAQVAELPDYNDARRISLLLPARDVGDGDATIAIVSDVFSDPRPLGVLIECAVVVPVGNAIALPPWSALLAGLVIVGSAYLALRQTNVPPAAAAAVAAAICCFGYWALASYRFPVAFWLAPLALLLLLSAASALPLRWSCDRVFAWLDVDIAPWLRDALIVMFLAGLWLKAGGMLFPGMRAIDISWHMDRVRWILDGNLAAVYRPGAFSESVMPIGEWGPNRPVIPYSPFFHIFSTAFALFPWPLETSANLYSAILDNSRVFLIAILARKVGVSQRATLLGALTYAVTPVTFLLHSWGNVPTTAGMWWTMVCTVLLVALFPRLHRPGPFALLTLLTTITLLFYTVMAIFHGIFVLAFAVIALLLPQKVSRRSILAAVGSLVVAVLLSVLVYYGQYIQGIIEKTLPYVASLATRGPESVGVQRPPFSAYLSGFWGHLRYDWSADGYLYYGVLIPLVFCIPGFVTLWKRPVAFAALAAWYSVAVLFMIAGYRISMVDKQLFYIVPIMCMCWGIYAERLWARGWWGRLLVATLLLFTLASAVDLWVVRIIRSPVV